MEYSDDGPGLEESIEFESIQFSGLFLVRLLAEELQNNGAKLVGLVSVEGYEFDESSAVVDGMFQGLPVDEDFEPELTDERVENWVKQIQPDFGF